MASCPQTPTPTTPETRSMADLQSILDSLIGPTGFVLSGNLPDVLSSYEIEYDLLILDPSEYNGLRTLCSQHADLELGPKELFNFLSMIPKPQPLNGRDLSPKLAGNMPHSASLPPTSFRAAQSTHSQSRQPSRRRHSDRVRSPSDSSSSGEEEEDIQRTQRKSFARTHSQPFPASAIPLPTSRHPLPPKRTKTLSDPSRLDSPLATRFRDGGVPPSAFGGVGAFSRPSPAGRRRRGSAGGTSSTEEGARSPEWGAVRPLGRSTSSASLGLTSPPWRQTFDSKPGSPISPTRGLDNTSFHIRAKSPEEVGEHVITRHEEMRFDPNHGEDGEDGEKIGVVDHDMPNTGSLDARLSRISTGSVTSLQTSHDKLQALQKQNAELARKLKESEKQLAILGHVSASFAPTDPLRSSENERLVEDLQDKLEEARSEVTQRRKDEKDMKGKERAQIIQIAGFEADIQSLQKSLESSKANHASMQKMYNSQCDEAQRLRELLRERDAEIKDLETVAQTHEADEEKFNREIKALETAIKRLESDLSSARHAESSLEAQKHENLALKETIDRMRFDLDEARAAAANVAGGSHQTVGTSGPQTLSRNLGDELNRRLQVAETTREEDEEGESVVETIVTTQRTRIGNRSAVGPGPSTSAPIFRIEEGVREYADAATETDPLPEAVHEHMSPHPPAYTAEPDAVNAEQVLDHAHPRELGHHGEGDEAYEALVNALGVRCTVIEEEVQLRKMEKAKRGAAVLPSESRKFHFKPGMVTNIYYQTADSLHNQVGKLVTWSVVAFAVGIIVGSHVFGAPAGLYPRDYHLFQQMNSLAHATGAGEGFLPIGHRGLAGIVGAGAGMVAGRVPT